MKASQLVLASLVAAVACSDSINPLGFFAKVNDTLMALTNKLFDHETQHSLLSWIDGSNIPTEVTFRNSYASTPAGYWGFREGEFVHGHKAKSQLHLDNNSKVHNQQFFSCVMLGGQFNAIRLINDSSFCFEADIYLLHYNRTDGTPIDGSQGHHSDAKPVYEGDEKYAQPTSKDDEIQSGKDQEIQSGKDQEIQSGKDQEIHHGKEYERSAPKDYEEPVSNSESIHSAKEGGSDQMESSSGSPGTSLVFFAKVGTDFVPLSAENYGTSYDNVTILSYGNTSATPAEFIIQDNEAFTENGSGLKSSRGFVGIVESTLVFGPYVHATNLNLSSDSKLLNGPFYTCQVFYLPIHWIMTRASKSSKYSPHCEQVEIYLMEYDRRTGSKSSHVPPEVPVPSEVPVPPEVHVPPQVPVPPEVPARDSGGKTLSEESVLSKMGGLPMPEKQQPTHDWGIPSLWM